MSKIEWTGKTWNPTTGCNKVSQGCKNCYAEVMHKRLNGMGQKKYQKPFLSGVEIHPDELDYPITVKKPTTFFVNSMSDLFHKDVPFVFIESVYNTMRKTPQHTYQVLTKRPEQAVKFYQWFAKMLHPGEVWPLPNVWIGISCEDQYAANERIPYLLQIPAAIRFLSCEPLLGPINLMEVELPEEIDNRKFNINCLTDMDDDHFYNVHRKINWVITGGESGHKSRPVHPNWIRSLRNQCKEYDVPFFFKQWGNWHESDLDEGKGIGKSRRHLWPDGKLMYNIGKKAAGNYLDGVQHLNMPAE